MGNHSFLSPSAAHRFMCCPMAPIHALEYPERSTPAAQEGTNAHKWAELVLQGLVDIADVPPDYALIKPYVEYVQDIQADTGSMVYLEHKVKIDCVRGFGTIDTLAIKPELEEVEIIDLKYGRIPVDIENNHQLMLYAIGYLSRGLGHLIGIKTVRTTICQPKLGLVDMFKTNIYHPDDLLQLSIDYKRQSDIIHELLRTGESTGYRVGGHCTWCEHRKKCPAYQEREFLEHAKMFS